MSAASALGLAAYFHSTDAPSAGASTPSAAAGGGPAGGSRSGGAGLASGTFTGTESDNRWGPVQVRITVAGDKITAADAVQAPDGDRRSLGISQRSIPTLVSETLTAQSANVNTVSGATYTSTSYKSSLQSAIDQARAAAPRGSA